MHVPITGIIRTDHPPQSEWLGSPPFIIIFITLLRDIRPLTGWLKVKYGTWKTRQVPPVGLVVKTLKKSSSAHFQSNYVKSPRWDFIGPKVPPVGLVAKTLKMSRSMDFQSIFIKSPRWDLLE